MTETRNNLSYLKSTMKNQLIVASVNLLRGGTFSLGKISCKHFVKRLNYFATTANTK